jgi:hypothetical protein
MTVTKQKQRWPKLHKRKAELGWPMFQHPGEDEFGLIAAEIAKVDGEIDALKREMLGEQSHQEYRQELGSELGQTKNKRTMICRPRTGMSGSLKASALENAENIHGKGYLERLVHRQ